MKKTSLLISAAFIGATVISATPSKADTLFEMCFDVLEKIEKSAKEHKDKKTSSRVKNDLEDLYDDVRSEIKKGKDSSTPQWCFRHAGSAASKVGDMSKKLGEF